MERRSADSRPRPGPMTVRRSVWRSPLVIITAVALLVTVGAIGALALTSNAGKATSPVSVVQPPATGINQYADGEAIGPADAPVVLEVYADYQCPWCGKFARETLPGLVRTYVAAGQLRIEERAIAFLGRTTPDESLDAAAAAACAAPARQVLGVLRLPRLEPVGRERGCVQSRPPGGDGERVGLEPDAFAACLDDPAVRGAIEARTRRRSGRGSSPRRPSCSTASG